MPNLLIQHADCIATFDHAEPAQGRELKDASLFVRGHVIEWIGPSTELPPALRDAAHETIDARGHLVTPGLVNTHHHMYQSLTRAIPGVQDAELFSAGCAGCTRSGPGSRRRWCRSRPRWPWPSCC